MQRMNKMLLWKIEIRVLYLEYVWYVIATRRDIVEPIIYHSLQDSFLPDPYRNWGMKTNVRCTSYFLCKQSDVAVVLRRSISVARPQYKKLLHQQLLENNAERADIDFLSNSK